MRGSSWNACRASPADSATACATKREHARFVAVESPQHRPLALVVLGLSLNAFHMLSPLSASREAEVGVGDDSGQGRTRALQTKKGAGASKASMGREAHRLANGRKIDINGAGVSELELLPGIGPSLAQRIVDHRNKKGPFSSVAQVEEVKGIGPGIIGKLRPFIQVLPVK